MDIFKLSREFFNWSFENPEKIDPGHVAIYFFAIEHCNRLGWKEKFGFPSQMVMEAVGIKNWKTYSKYLGNLVEWGFIEMIEISKNQYSSNIIRIATVKNTKANTKALDKALSKHSQKQVQSIASIDIQETSLQETRNNTAIAVIENEVVEEHGKNEINLMQRFLRQAVGVTAFKDSKERWYVTHCHNLMKKIGKDEFEIRLREILSDPFKAKNCNKIAYLYGEMKSFIHSPVVGPKQTPRKSY